MDRTKGRERGYRMNRRQTGTAYERRAGEYLKEQGYELIGYNFRCRQGEIDIIARDGRYLVFVEVKYRGTARWGDSLSAVDFRKQQRISRTALYYLARHGYGTETPCRFDVVGITPTGTTLIKNAFEFRG